jgi:hypothetical protein
MPKAGLKEKSSRTTTRSTFENSAPNARPEDSDVEMGDETSSDEEDVPEKDEAERKLERMLFGDDEGFMGALKNQQDREARMALALNSDESDAGEASEEDEGQDLAGMADSDVCNPSSEFRASICRAPNLTYVVPFSFSSSIQVLLPPLIFFHLRKPHRMPRRTRKTTSPRCGTTAMMIASPCH